MKDHLETSIFGDQEPHPQDDDVVAAPPPRTRREAREAELAATRARKHRGGRKGGKPSILRRLLVIVLALGVIAGGVGIAYTFLRPVVEGWLESNDYPGPGTGTVMVTVEQGAGGSAIATELAEQDVVKSSKAFIEAVKDDPKSAGIQPGVYEMRKQMKATDALALLVDPANRRVERVTIPEGKWADEIYPLLSKVTGIPVAEYQKAAKDAGSLGLPSSAKGNVEGYLFPASYEFEPDSSAADHLKQMVSESTKRLQALGVSPDQMERVVVVASLIEGEAQTPEDMAKVSRVVENRLQADMSLGFDSTVNYIFKKRGVPTQKMLESDSPYNTRIRKGLPPGPIANPGEKAIEAAVKPAEGPWLYFVTVNLDSGETKFTASEAEFWTFVDEFNAFCKNSPKC